MQAAARMDEDIPSPEMTMAQLFDKEKGSRSNAEKWLKQAVAADPKKLKTRLDAVQWMLRTGDLNASQGEATEALAIDPESHDALFLAGRVAEQLHRGLSRKAQKATSSARTWNRPAPAAWPTSWP